MLGNLTCGCVTAGPHFNPFGKTHGGPDSDVRHVGDLGNVLAGEDGVANYELDDHMIMIYGNENNVIGRSCVVHANQDDCGKGGNDESLKTGNAGSRLSCGVIGLSGPFQWFLLLQDYDILNKYTQVIPSLYGRADYSFLKYCGL